MSHISSLSPKYLKSNQNKGSYDGRNLQAELAMSAENLSRQVDMSISGTLNTPFKLAEIRISTYSTVLPLGKRSQSGVVSG